MNTMKTLLAAAIIAASTQAHATYQEPIPLPIPEIETDGGDDTAAIILGVGILAFILLHQMRKDTPEDLSTPRPTVRPEGCLDKFGNIAACE